MFRKYERKLERDLQRDKWTLFEALQGFANIRPDTEGWAHFRRLWPNFFPMEVYDRAEHDLKPSVRDYPYWLDQIWSGGETEPHLRILMGLDTAPDQGTPEDARIADLSTIPVEFSVDWDEGSFRYHGVCDFQRALYLLFRESWRARVCEKCSAKFIGRRAAQKYCTTDCSEAVQRELKQEWWAENGEEWRKQRIEAMRVSKGGRNGTRKAR
jgi:hypothetical protein